MAVSDAPTSAPGTLGPGTGAWGAMLSDASEHVPDLLWPWSIPVLSRMRLDPTLASVLAAYIRPVVAAAWAVDPAGADEAHARLVADALGLPMVGERQKPGPQRRRGVLWDEHLRLAVSGVLTWGHMPFAPWYEIRDGRAVLAGLPERMPASLSGIDVDDRTGELTGIKQHDPRSGDEITIPADRLLYYVHDREGSAWWGRSLLRPAYGPWLLKQDTMRVHATTLRRFGAGTPVMEPIPGFNPTNGERQAAQVLAQNVRVGDSAGAVTPGFRLRIAGIEGTLPDAMPFLRYLDEQMARMSLASVLDLGSTPNGSRALGSEFGDLLALSLNAIAAQLAATVTRGVCVRMTDYNLGEDAPAPAVVVGDVGANPAELAKSIAELVTAGALTMDNSLEDFVRDGLRLPARESDALPPPPGAARQEPPQDAPGALGEQDDEGDEPPAVGEPVLAARAAADRSYRALTAVEAAAAVDPATIDAATDEATEAAVEAWPAAADDMREQVVQAVQEAVASGDLATLARFLPDTTQAEQVTTAAVTAGAAIGVDSANAEAASQGVAPPAAAPDTAALQVAAGAVAVTLAAGMVAAATRAAARLAGRSPDADSVAAAVDEQLRAQPSSYITEQLGAAVNTGLNTGRTAVFEAATKARYFHSAIRDRNTCEACAANDGHEYANLAGAEADFPTGGYALCLGRERCRCIIVANWDPR